MSNIINLKKFIELNKIDINYLSSKCGISINRMKEIIESQNKMSDYEAFKISVILSIPFTKLYCEDVTNEN
jgi:plasmid maintenance system antidote protein VapI